MLISQLGSFPNQNCHPNHRHPQPAAYASPPAPPSKSPMKQTRALTAPPKLVGGFNPIWKNISQNGNFPQVGVKIENIWNHHPEKKQHLNGNIFCCGHRREFHANGRPQTWAFCVFFCPCCWRGRKKQKHTHKVLCPHVSCLISMYKKYIQMICDSRPFSGVL